MSRVRRSDLIGRTITDVEWRRRWDGKTWIIDPRLTLDTGQKLTIVTIPTHDKSKPGHWFVLSEPEA